MPFSFAYICNLLEKLHHIYARHPPYLPRDVQLMSTRVITLWFKKHELRIKNEVDGLLLLSILQPEKYVDRIFSLSERDLAKVVGRAFSLSTAQFEAVSHKANAGDLSDLGHRVEQVTKQSGSLPFSRTHDVSIEEINRILSLVARQQNPVSGASQPLLQTRSPSVLKDDLGPLYQYLAPRERKWLTRLLLKSYAPIVMPEDLIFSLYHPLLPGLIRASFDLRAALRFIQRLEHQPHAHQREELLSESAPEVAHPSPLGTERRLSVTENESPLDPGATRSRPASVLAPKSPEYVTVDGVPANRANSVAPSPRKRSQPLSDITNAGQRCSDAFPTTNIPEGQPEKPTSSQTLIDHPPSPRRSNSARRPEIHHVCPQEGRRCVFYKKDIGLLPSMHTSAKLKKLLAKHKIYPIQFETFLNGLRKPSARQRRTRRRILLVDRAASGVQDALDRIGEALHDLEGQKQWVDVYDWRLLVYIDKVESCCDTKMECARRYWMGVV